eukprot:m.190473 g.190473  ORF g.190473 m.190473 type:complete len:319 (+) comp10042_c1_seq4:266-1222(+)
MVPPLFCRPLHRLLERISVPCGSMCASAANLWSHGHSLKREVHYSHSVHTLLIHTSPELRRTSASLQRGLRVRIDGSGFRVPAAVQWRLCADPQRVRVDRVPAIRAVGDGRVCDLPAAQPVPCAALQHPDIRVRPHRAGRLHVHMPARVPGHPRHGWQRLRGHAHGPGCQRINPACRRRQSRCRPDQWRNDPDADVDRPAAKQPASGHRRRVQRGRRGAWLRRGSDHRHLAGEHPARADHYRAHCRCIRVDRCPRHRSRCQPRCHTGLHRPVHLVCHGRPADRVVADHGPGQHDAGRCHACRVTGCQRTQPFNSCTGG